MAEPDFVRSRALELPDPVRLRLLRQSEPSRQCRVLHRRHLRQLVDNFRPVVGIEFLHNVANMNLYCAFLHAEFVSNDFVRFPLP